MPLRGASEINRPAIAGFLRWNKHRTVARKVNAGNAGELVDAGVLKADVGPASKGRAGGDDVDSNNPDRALPWVASVTPQAELRAAKPAVSEK